ncbi:MAG: PKD domain-containing protein, partial [Actinomycetota bacterium]
IPTLFTGDNLFRIDLVAGGLIGTSTTLPWSLEPTGLAWDPASGRVFVSDDDADEVFELDPGPDGLHGTPDDSMSSFDTRLIGSSLDPEGIAYDFVENRLYIADGLNSEVYEIDPGPNGLFDGIPPVGDDTFSSFDTSIFGALDPEGIAYDSDNGFLYLTGSSATTVYHVTTTGSLIRTLDITAAGASNPAGLEFAPSSPDPLVNGLYIADRGIDNDSEPDENDGRIFEVAVPPITPGNLPPQVDAGPDLALVLPAVAVLDATVSDPLVPAGTLVVEWSQLSGPGTVSFGDPLAVDTTASFFAAGTYVLRLTADDGELFLGDEVVVSVTGSIGEQIAEIPIAAGSD